jgi:hypothetical protein
MAAIGPAMTIRIAMTMNVSGRSSAARTIQVIDYFAFSTNQTGRRLLSGGFPPAVRGVEPALRLLELRHAINPLTARLADLCYRPVRRIAGI